MENNNKIRNLIGSCKTTMRLISLLIAIWIGDSFKSGITLGDNRSVSGSLFTNTLFGEQLPLMNEIYRLSVFLLYKLEMTCFIVMYRWIIECPIYVAVRSSHNWDLNAGQNWMMSVQSYQRIKHMLEIIWDTNNVTDRIVFGTKFYNCNWDFNLI